MNLARACMAWYCVGIDMISDGLLSGAQLAWLGMT